MIEEIVCWWQFSEGRQLQRKLPRKQPDCQVDVKKEPVVEVAQHRWTKQFT